MRAVTSFKHELRPAEHVWVPMPDGARLAGRLWRPVSSDGAPAPGICEAIPYRQRDLTSVRDSIHHPYLAGHGYACLRLDLRGSGDSDGVLEDEYTEQEHCDIEAALSWLAAQPWCTGRTGLMGISWGAFAGLQVAARRPPSLGAIVIASFTDDRYADDMHYMGGCLLSDNLAEAGTMFAYSTLPPDPAVVGERWRDMWYERLHAAEPWILKWLAHQRRDDYWRRGSVCEDYAAVQVPVFASSGWADGYSNAIFRVLEHLDVPRRASSGRGRTSTRTSAFRARPSATCRRSCAGSTAGYGTSPTGPRMAPRCASGCRRACRPLRRTRSARDAGPASRAGRRRT